MEKSYGNLLTAERVMLESKNLERGKLSIGLPSHIASFFFFDKIVDFHNKYPNIEIVLMNGSTRALLELLDKHTIDFIIDTGPINTNNKDLDIVKLSTVKYSFICNKDNYKDYGDIKSLKDLEDKPLVLPIEGTSNRKALNELFLKNNIKPKKVMSIHKSEVILNAVDNNLGIGYIINNIIKNNEKYKVLDIKEELPTADIDVVFNKKFITSAPKRFMEEYINIEIK